MHAHEYHGHRRIHALLYELSDTLSSLVLNVSPVADVFPYWCGSSVPLTS